MLDFYRVKQEKALIESMDVVDLINRLYSDVLENKQPEEAAAAFIMSPKCLGKLVIEREGRAFCRWGAHIIVCALSSEDKEYILFRMSKADVQELRNIIKIAIAKPRCTVGSNSLAAARHSNLSAGRKDTIESNDAIRNFVTDCWTDGVAELDKWLSSIDGCLGKGRWLSTNEVWPMLGCKDQKEWGKLMEAIRKANPDRADEIKGWIRGIGKLGALFDMDHFGELCDMCDAIRAKERVSYNNADYIELTQLLAELQMSSFVWFSKRKKLNAENIAKLESWFVTDKFKKNKKYFPIEHVAEFKEMLAALPNGKSGWPKGRKRVRAETPEQPKVVAKPKPIRKIESAEQPNLVMPQQPKNQLEVRVLQAYLDEMQELFGYIHQYSQQTEADKAAYIKRLGSATAAETVGLLSDLTVANNTLLELQRLESDAQKYAAEILRKAENEFSALVADLRQIKK